MNFKELSQMTLEDQRKWAEEHPVELGETVYNECGTQHNQTGSVLPPQCCFVCQGCPLKALVVGVTRT
jgi:hypothetical protein